MVWRMERGREQCLWNLLAEGRARECGWAARTYIFDLTDSL